MIRDSINAVIDYLYQSAQTELALELIYDALTENLIDKDSVSDILNDIAIDDNDHSVVVTALEIMNDFEIEKCTELKHKHITNDLKYRMEEVVRFIPNEDLAKVAKSRIDGIIYDLSEYLNQLSDSQ